MRESYSLAKVLGVQGIKVDIIPTTEKFLLTEMYNKKGEYLGRLIFDNRKGWKRFVLFDLDKDMQLSKECIDEAFDLTVEYWKEEVERLRKK